MKYFESNGFNLNIINYEGKNPLHICALNGNIAIANYFLPRVDKNLKDKNGLSPLFYAIKFKKEDMIELFIKSGCQIEIEENLIELGLRYVSFRYEKGVECFRKANIDLLSFKDSMGNTIESILKKKISSYQELLNELKSIKI